ncbi:hypothetical protein [Paenibacillus daejeonensis]|uniref:hypothetical protein n=1 Tax=Paenibacillus daejeonensis TaxID=135193 RepID=UPI00035E1D51|nr:hypothetical protein [Paenibacillus daejeonensis]
MDHEITFVLTLLLFVVVFSFLYFQIHGSASRVKMWFFIFLVISIGPLIYIQIDDFIKRYPDANIGLGLAYFYSWFMIVIAAVVAVVSYVRKKSNAH